MAANNLPLDSTPTPLEHTVRLLYPFWIDAGNLDKAVRALSLQHHAGRKREFKTWQEAGRTPDLYREEILPLVTQVLFGIRSGANRYLCVDKETLNHWFPRDGVFESHASGQDLEKTQVHAEQPPAHPLIPAGEGIELFLSPHGVGLLALTFDCAQPGDLKYLQTFNYRLSQLREHTVWQYRIPLDPRSPNPPPDAQAPFGQRLGVQGGAFTLKELVDFLLAPLRDFGLLETQQQFSVYSVTRFDKRAQFTKADCQAELRPFLSALAHVEEATHQGSLELRERILNPRHWAAVGSLGAAHLLADQDPPHPFDRQRLSRSLYKYFVPYLCAGLQRLTLQRLLWETDQAVLEANDCLQDRQAKLRKLHQEMLCFSVQGCFTEISNREVHNQYYELALEGLRVPASLRLVQRVLGDMESATTAAFQQETAQGTRDLARDVGYNVGVMADIQRKVEWLEVFFVSYYATALAHYVGEGFAVDYAQWSVMAAPFLFGLIALVFIKPWEAHPARQETGTGGGKPLPKHTPRKSWVFLGLMSVIVLAWMAVGWHCYPAGSADEDRTVICQNEGDCHPGSGKGTI